MASSRQNGTSGAKIPALKIPESNITISVKIIDVSTISDVPVDKLFTPSIPGIKTLAPAPSFCFLLEHPSGRKLVFDLGIRKDWENLAPEIVSRLKAVGHKPTVQQNVSEFLDEAGVGKENVNAVVWSHAHWDHMGDMSTFGPSTDLIVGPGFKDYFMGSGNGNSALGGVLPSDVEGRNVREINMNGPQTLRVGQFLAYDYFNDGSLYLLDTPGHCVGHLCALVRTTAEPSTFVFLGGDAAHHCAELRPSAYVPMPESITPNPLPEIDSRIPFCPGAWFEDLQTSRNRDPKGPLYQPSFGHDMGQVLETIDKMQEYDGDDNVFVILAHDSTLRSTTVPQFPKSINDWKARGLATEFRWAWIGDIMAALKN